MSLLHTNWMADHFLQINAEKQNPLLCPPRFLPEVKVGLGSHRGVTMDERVSLNKHVYLLTRSFLPAEDHFKPQDHVVSSADVNDGSCIQNFLKLPFHLYQ